jgi:N-acetylglucosaminyldiphosphoundecaprenol N-acetyl-beta-D-mannosaminyltransferase
MNPDTKSNAAEYNLRSFSFSHDASMISILGVNIFNAFMDEALDLLEKLINARENQSYKVFIVNAHTLNIATEDLAYRKILNSADIVFGDGVGVRLAGRLQGEQIKSNLAGTDLIPQFLQVTGNSGYRYFLLGGSKDIIEKAAKTAETQFPGWELAGYHHGYFAQDEAEIVIDKINATQPHLLLVGMGNPIQECWIHNYADSLRVPLVVGVGGLFHYWADDLERAPIWLRKTGLEWLGILIQQPHKWKRYIMGNPKFIFRILLDSIRLLFDVKNRASAPELTKEKSL